MSETGDRSDESQGGVFKIIGIGCGVLLLLGLIGAVVIYKKIPSMAAAAITKGVEATLAESNLPAEQKTALNARARRLSEEIKNKTLPMKQATRIVDRLKASGFLMLIVLESMHPDVLNHSGLDDPGKRTARLDLQRLQRGVVEGRIKPKKLDEIFGKLGQPVPSSGIPVMNTNPSAAQIADFLKAIKTEADGAGIPSEPYIVDYAALLDRLIQQVKSSP